MSGMMARPWTTVVFRNSTGRVPRSVAGAVGMAILTVAACTFGLTATTAWADDVGDIAFEVAAENLEGSGTVVVHFDEGAWDEATGTFTWVLDTPQSIYSEQGDYVATIIDAAVFARCNQPCAIETYLGVAAGMSNTTFVARSPLVTFPTLPEEGAGFRAVASVTLTDAAEGSAALLSPEGDGTGGVSGVLQRIFVGRHAHFTLDRAAARYKRRDNYGDSDRSIGRLSRIR